MSVSAAYISWKMAMEITPVILTGGIAASIGGTMPIVTLTETTASLLAGAVSAGSNPLAGLFNTATGGLGLSGIDSQLDSFFAHFVPMSGAKLINNQVAPYPFANQQVAANAIIAQPLSVSLKMICPARGQLGYPLKLATMTSLQRSLYKHNSLGGLYSVVTPSYIYTNCILINLQDISAGEGKQPQEVWEWDFYQPLLTLQAATQAQNSLLSAFTNGTPTTGTQAGATGLSIGSPSNSLTQTLGSSGLAL